MTDSEQINFFCILLGIVVLLFQCPIYFARVLCNLLCPYITQIPDDLSESAPGICFLYYLCLCRRRSTVFLRLQFEHLCILAVHRHQLIMASGFDQLTVREHENSVRHTGG